MTDFKSKNFDTLEAGYNHVKAENERLIAAIKELGKSHERDLSALHAQLAEARAALLVFSLSSRSRTFRAKLAEARAVIAPFAALSEPTDDDTRFEVIVHMDDPSGPTFTGADLARARKFMEETSGG